MELKVWVEGIQRIVCGVTVNTTCQDVVFALAHATGKVGRFTLIERWRNNERLLAPNENPLKLLLKWGEYANDVQFILQRSENKQQQQQQLQQQQTRVDATTGSNHNKHTNNNDGNNMKIHNNSNINNNNIVGGDTKNTQMINSVMKKPLGLSNTNNNNSNNNNSNYNNNNANNIQHSIESSAYNDQQQQQQQQQTNDLNINSVNEKRRELKKSFGAYDGKHNENIGVVKGIPQRHNIIVQQQYQHQQQQYQHKSTSSQSHAPPTVATTRHATELPNLIPKHEKSHSNPIDMMNSYAYNNNNNNNSSNNSGMGNSTPYNDSNSNNIYNQIGAYNSKSINEINLAVVRSSLDRRTNDNEDLTDMVFSANHTFGQINNNNNNNSSNMHNQNNSHNNGSTCSNENLLDVYNGNSKYNVMNTSPDIYKNAPTISAIGALVPPPYRDPPPPRNSPLQPQQQLQRMHVDNIASSPVAQNVASNTFSSDYANDFDFDYQSVTNSQNSGGGNGDNAGMNNNNMDESESIFQATQYNDLLQLIKFQREKISAQQVELNKYDAEIGFLENKERDQAHELDVISREITKADSIFRQGGDQLQALQYVEEENELVKQQEKTLKSEIALLRSKLANCETELLQCKNKIRILMDDIEMEQRTVTTKQKNNRQNVERDFLMEMERIQSEIDQAIHNADSSNKTTDTLKKEIVLIENAIAEKKRQVEQLVNEMKEVNLQSLTVTTSEEIKHLLEGSNKPGSTRRIIGSPRQLENAVPTSKNPHGVWV